MSDKPLRVIQVLPELNVGGVERGTIEWALALQSMGHDAMVISGGGAGADYLNQNAVRHFTLPVGKKRLSSLRLVKKLRELFTSIKPDIIHVRSRMPAWLCHFALKKMDAPPPLITTLHGLHTVSPYAAIMAKGDRVIAVSETAANYLNFHYSKYLKRPPVIIHRGINADEFPHQAKANESWVASFNKKFPHMSQRYKVLLPGRLTAVKGGMNILPWLKEAEKDVVLMVNAEPNESQYARSLKAAADHAQVADQVVWLGTERDMSSLYAHADLVLSVNQKPESFGRTVLEALSMGRPVVAYDHGGVSEIMRAIFPQGLIPKGDVNALTETIGRFRKEPPVVPPHQQFRVQDQFDQTLAVYREVLSCR